MKRLFGLIVLVLAACGQGAGLKVEGGQYRAPLVDGAPGVAYFSVTSPTADRIVGLSSPQSALIEMHESVVGDGGVASMHKIDSVELPAGKAVTFGAGGMHVMIFSPTSQPANATFPIQITLESGRVETISLPDANSAEKHQ